VRFLADMGVDVRAVEWLRRHGHDAVHLRDEGLHRALDEQVFAKALAEPTCPDSSEDRGSAR
jgi:predicted nuclease of predicted toxin-antitoxin system